ncbi:fasciclin domain-containing protein [Flavobacterium sp. WC2509]|uniref:fasciclin domain-containing protein n=1 Tax=Flavobacterium sp. WC2509 TaxID=3461406 RepID=UPI004044F074
MKKTLHYYLLVLPLLALLFGCSSDVYDEYYGRPENLEDPIFQRLEAKGNFKNFTALIEKAGYKDILGKSGYWTVFAPNDDAFAKYFQEHGISDVTKIDDATAAKIVKYAIVYNAFKEDRLSDYQSAKGWVEGSAFRRRTAYYDGFVIKTIKGEQKVVIGINRNFGAASYVPGDNNNKYVTYFMKEYFQANSLSSYDFNFFYPNKEYTGFNFFDSKVLVADGIAENGVFHEVDQVNLPLMNIDQYLEQDSNLGANSKFSLFRKILENNLVTYVLNQSATTAYYNYTGKTDNVYIKTYDPILTFAPNNENFIKAEDNDGQSSGYTLIVPENAPLQTFVDNILLKHYASIDLLPKYVFQDVINAHMVQGSVWPSKNALLNGLKEGLTFNFNTDITDRKVLSNGFFYGSNKVQKSNIFYTVYTSAYLDPSYGFATRLFNEGSGYKELISNINTRFTLLLPSDATLINLGFNYDTRNQYWTYNATGVSETGSAARSRLLRLFYNCIILSPKGELDNIATSSGIIRTGDSEIPGEYIRWSNNKVYAAGDDALGTSVNIIGKEIQENGITYYVDKFPQFSTELQGLVIKRLATSNAQFNSFYQYLLNSTVYFPASGKIDGVELGTSYTFIVPNNAAIAKAVADGVLPASNNPTIQGEKDLVADFIRYHIIVNRTASNDGLSTGLFETLRKDSKGEKTYLQVSSVAGTSSVPGTLSFKDNSDTSTSTNPNPVPNPAANLIISGGNNLADRSLIHLVDNYLKFTE